MREEQDRVETRKGNKEGRVGNNKVEDEMKGERQDKKVMHEKKVWQVKGEEEEKVPTCVLTKRKQTSYGGRDRHYKVREASR